MHSLKQSCHVGHIGGWSGAPIVFKINYVDFCFAYMQHMCFVKKIKLWYFKSADARNFTLQPLLVHVTFEGHFSISQLEQCTSLLGTPFAGHVFKTTAHRVV